MKMNLKCWNFALSFYLLESFQYFPTDLLEKIFSSHSSNVNSLRKNWNVCLNRSTDTCELIVKTSQQTLFGKSAETQPAVSVVVVAAAVAVAILAQSSDTLRVRLFIQFWQWKSTAHTLRISRLSVWMCLHIQCGTFEYIPTKKPNRSTLLNRYGRIAPAPAHTRAATATATVAAASEQMITLGEAM